MKIVNMLEAKSSLSRLVDAIERGDENEIIITRRGKPSAKLVPMGNLTIGPRIGIAEGMFAVPENIDISNDKIAQLFLGK